MNIQLYLLFLDKSTYIIVNKATNKLPNKVAKKVADKVANQVAKEITDKFLCEYFCLIYSLDTDNKNARFSPGKLAI